MKKYKSIFIPSTIQDSSRGQKYYTSKVNGELMANDIQATIMLHQEEGFEFHSMSPISSTKYYGQVYTEGMIVVFIKDEI